MRSLSFKVRLLPQAHEARSLIWPVVAAFTTVEAALADLPALLSYRRSTDINESRSSLLERALDFDPGTLLISPDVLGLELTPDESIIQAVVIGAALLYKLREIKQACSEAGGHTTWLIVDVEKSKRLGLGQEAEFREQVEKGVGDLDEGLC
jgi:hypothetical protein